MNTRSDRASFRQYIVDRFLISPFLWIANWFLLVVVTCFLGCARISTEHTEESALQLFRDHHNRFVDIANAARCGKNADRLMLEKHSLERDIHHVEAFDGQILFIVNTFVSDRAIVIGNGEYDNSESLIRRLAVEYLNPVMIADFGGWYVFKYG